MINRIFLGSVLILSFTWYANLALSETNQEKTLKATASTDHEDPEGYYTCPMHPQVHQHEPGNCPICGMKLVKVPGKQEQQDHKGHQGQVASGGPQIQTTQTQLNLAGIGKYTVVRKDMTFTVPVSGRMLSSREVVFQVFESDLQVVRNGLEFTGSVSTSPHEELKGRIRSVDSLVDPSSRTVRVVGTLNQAPLKFVLEGGFHGEIIATEKDQIAIPEEAVLHTGQGNRVYIISQDNILKAVPVTLGKKGLREYQILSGLHVGDVISSGPNFLIDSEAKIRGNSGQAHH